LWAALDAQAKEDTTLSADLTVGDIMNTWTLQKGYPVVHVKRLSANQLNVSQKYFLLNPLNSLQNNKNNTAEYDSYKWYVPFTYTTKVSPNFDFESETEWLKPSVSSCKF
jgi:aminopeptidase N